MRFSAPMAYIIITIVLLLEQGYIAEPSKQGALRLADGNEYEGRLEVYLNYASGWGAFCSDGWGWNETNTACTLLGFNSTLNYTFTTYSTVATEVLLVECHGYETSLLGCSYERESGNCTSDSAVYIQCGPSDASSYVRLIDGSGSVGQGRIEIYSRADRRWETVCDMEWDINDSHVLCRQLGYGSAQQLVGGAYFGEGNSNTMYHTKDYYCFGDEATLDECLIGPLSTTCNAFDHSNDAGVICSDGDNVIMDSYIRLVDGNFVGQGRLEVYYNGQWGTVCDDDWTTSNADVVCRQLGLGSATDYYINVGDVGIPHGSGPIWLDDVWCSGLETSFFSCSHDGWGYHNCNHDEDVAVVCNTENDDARIRLLGASNSYSGRVELYHSGTWSTVCGNGWDIDDAEVACKMAGYLGAEEYYTNAAFGQGTGNILLSNLACTGTEDNLFECEHSGWYRQTCSHGEDVGVVCRQFDVRLVEGSTANEGRVEVHYNGDWATICDDRWGIKDGHVICQQLGYGSVISVHAEAYFGQGSGLIALNHIQCTGTESTLSECPASYWGEHDCTHEEDAGVVCSPLENGAVRLRDGNTIYEGRVEVFRNGVWGTICDDNWGHFEGDVVCNQLRYGYAVYIFSNAYFGEGTGDILLDDVVCSRTESAISECFHNGWGVHNCLHREDAGVQCSGRSGGTGLDIGSVIGIIGFHIIVIFIACSLCKYCQTHGDCNTNCGDKVSSTCGNNAQNVSVTTACLSSDIVNENRRLQSTSLLSVERTFIARDAVVSYNHNYRTASISGLVSDSHCIPSSRTRSMLPPSYDSAMQMTSNSVHGFPTTHEPPLNLPSSYHPHSYSEYPFTEEDAIEIPNSPPPSYESVIGEHENCNQTELNENSTVARHSSTTTGINMFGSNCGQTSTIDSSHQEVNSVDCNTTSIGD